ncbi:hypothetical protein HDU84_007621 [Entophlyctis sp. JEL0112]|nr:hypothetical protein HDU84_007621 [Entophlyctis sp. JEL0112]
MSTTTTDTPAAAAAAAQAASSSWTADDSNAADSLPQQGDGGAHYANRDSMFADSEVGSNPNFADFQYSTSAGFPATTSAPPPSFLPSTAPQSYPNATAMPKRFMTSPLKDSSGGSESVDTIIPLSNPVFPPPSTGIAAGTPVHSAPSGLASARKAMSYAFGAEKEERTNKGNTKIVMDLLSEMWIFNLLFLMGAIYFMTFYLGKLQSYDDYYLWNTGCYWKIGWLLPLPYTLICLFGLILPYRTPKFLNYAAEGIKKRRLDNLYIVTVTKGDNKEAVMRAWDAHRHLEAFHPAVRVHVLTDEPYFFDGINCYTCPKNYATANSKYKARALEWYRQTMKFTEHDWILHLDEESVIDDESVKRVLEFIWYQKDYHFGQGVILYNQYKYWSNWVFTVGDAIRVGDDLSRFQLQYTYFHRPIFGAHGSFLLNNGLVENAVTWDLGSLTEDYQFAVKAWDRGFRCGKICALVREQSPLDVMGFLKQRRRWFVGIRRLPNFLPKLWAFFWSLGIFSLYCTIASIPLGFLFPYTTPRWFGFLKDVSFVTFVYLYLLGIFVQDIDSGKHPLIVFIHMPMTLVLQYVCVVMEGCAVMYAIVAPPKDFDVIKK